MTAHLTACPVCVHICVCVWVWTVCVCVCVCPQLHISHARVPSERLKKISNEPVMDWWPSQSPKLLITEVCVSVCVCVYLDRLVCCTVPPQCADPGRCPLRKPAGGYCRFASSCSVPLRTSQSTWTMKTSTTSCRPLKMGMWGSYMFKLEEQFNPKTKNAVFVLSSVPFIHLDAEFWRYRT